MVNSLYEDTLNNFKIDYQGGIANTPVGPSVGPDEIAISGQRSQIVRSIENIESSLGNINVEISGIVKKRSKINIDAYYTIMDQIRVVKSQIIDANNQIEELTKKVDPISAIAERDETHILSKQKYYMYILWFIIAAIVIYITIVNMINPNASFSVLVICIIILVCLFVFIMYNNITGAWYNDIKNGISDISIPRMENSFQNMFNFDPLVSIKYTS
jgi:NADH:ubiquinone oxidoreductase subunit 3 (subunit A)